MYIYTHYILCIYICIYLHICVFFFTCVHISVLYVGMWMDMSTNKRELHMLRRTKNRTGIIRSPGSQDRILAACFRNHDLYENMYIYMYTHVDVDVSMSTCTFVWLMLDVD